MISVALLLDSSYNDAMIINEQFNYTDLKRTDSPSGRLYLCPDGSKVPSVTTILNKTKTEEKKQALANWKARVGEQAAQQIVTEAAGRGTSMHKQIERWILGESTIPGSNMVHQQAYKMAQKVIDELIEPNVNEIWGNEVGLHYPGLYAGTTDCTGVWQNNEAILDFKQTNKPKKREWIEDYFLQLCAYAAAHNVNYGTKIKTGVILMCSKDLDIQHWVLENEEFDKYTAMWWDRVEQYYKER